MVAKIAESLAIASQDPLWWFDGVNLVVFKEDWLMRAVGEMEEAMFNLH